MFTIKIENKIGSELTLTQNESDFQVVNIDGLNPPQAHVNVSDVAGMDGALFNSSRLETRNIVLTVKINGDIEANRMRLYRQFITKEYSKLFYKNNTLDVFIEGYVDTFELNHFTNSETAQISIICPNPYFKDLEMIIDDISKVIKRFYFPFSINIDEPIPISEIELQRLTNVLNSSESETGVIVDVRFIGEVNKLEIKNVVTGEGITINYPFTNGDLLVINTNRGSKSVILTREGVEYNLIPNVKKGSIFFQLATGDNKFNYLANDGDVDQFVTIQFMHYNVYRGV